MWNIKSKTAFISGGAKRLGAEIALSLAEEGLNCVIHYNRSEEEAETLCKQLMDKGVKAWALQADFTDPRQAGLAVTRGISLAGSLDILILSASLYKENTLCKTEPEEFHRDLDINALAPLYAARAFAGQQKEGAIITILDSRMEDYDKNHIAYHISKRVLYSFTRMMCLEFAPLLRVNGVAPGIILPEEGKDNSYLEVAAKGNLLGRIGTVKEFTETILFLIKNQFITGQVVFVDGGRNLRGKVY